MLIDEINKIGKEFNVQFAVESATFKTESLALVLCLIYPDEVMLTEDMQKKVREVVDKFLPEGISKATIKYKKNYYDQEMMEKAILEFFHREKPIVSISKEDVVLSSKTSVSIDVEEKFSKLIDENLLNLMKTYLKDKFYTDFQIDYKFVPSKNVVVEEDDVFVEDVGATNYKVKLKSKEPYVGELVEDDPVCLATVAEQCEGVTICGRIKNFRHLKTKAKVTEDGKERPEKDYFTFELYDYSGEIKVVYFSGKANLSKAEKLADGLDICCFGKVEESLYDSGLNFRPKTICLVEFEEGFFEKVYTKNVPRTYSYVKPEPYVATEQANLFVKDEPITNEFILNNKFVVFDLETTGTTFNKDKIIEIGAVKIENGKMTETFSTLVDPCMHIPDDATKINHITDDEVAGAPKIEQVIPDFYKFCDGAVIVSYVIGFDFSFISYYGKLFGYAFKHQTYDAYALAKEKVKGVHNYKLTTICESMGIVLENAHRAVYDAIAAAEVVLKLLKNN